MDAQMDCPQYLTSASCSFGAGCKYRHSEKARVNPDCRNWLNDGRCPRGVSCYFIHHPKKRGGAGSSSSEQSRGRDRDADARPQSGRPRPRSSSRSRALSKSNSNAALPLAPAAMAAALAKGDVQMQFTHCKMEEAGGKVTVAVQQQTLHREVERKKVDVTFLIDVSGSMQGEPLATALEGVAGLHKELNDSDRVSLLLFDTNRFNLMEPNSIMKKENLNIESLIAKAKGKGGGGTYLRDAMIWAMEEIMPKHPHAKENGYIQQLVVLTDGADTGSDVSREKLAEAVANCKIPKFNLIFLSVGVSGSARDEYQALCAPKHCHFMECDSNAAANIKKLFRDVIKTVKESKVLQITGAPQQVARMLQGMNLNPSAGSGSQKKMPPMLTPNAFKM